MNILLVAQKNGAFENLVAVKSPETNGFISAGGGKRFTIRGNGHAMDGTRVLEDGLDLLAAALVDGPVAHGRIGAAGGQVFAVRSDRQAEQRRGALFENLDGFRLLAGDVPEADGGVVAAGGHPFAVGEIDDLSHRSAM